MIAYLLACAQEAVYMGAVALTMYVCLWPRALLVFLGGGSLGVAVAYVLKLWQIYP